MVNYRLVRTTTDTVRDADRPLPGITITEHSRKSEKSAETGECLRGRIRRCIVWEAAPSGKSVLTSAVSKTGKVLIKGAYGEHMGSIAAHAGLKHTIINFDYNEVPDAEIIAND